MTVPAATTHRFSAFGGARCEIVAPAAGGEVLSGAVAEVYAFEARLTRFDRHSELSCLNRAGGRRTAVSPLLEALLRCTLEAWEHSDGLVNAAALPALHAAGYDCDIRVVRARGGAHLPRAQQPDQPLAPLPAVLEVGDGWATLDPAAAIDLGGVGKGWLADVLAERIGDCVVNLGGDLRTAGSAPGGAPWVIGIDAGRTVELGDAGVATSGTVGRAWPGGHHLIDPRTGHPAAVHVPAVTVVAGCAVDAEVLAKSVIILGADAAACAWATARGAAHVVVDSGASASALASALTPASAGASASASAAVA